MEKVKLPNRPLGPFPTVLVGVDVDGSPNYVTVGACGVVSLDAVLYISLKSTHYSTKGVKATGYFSINLPSSKMVQKTDYCGVVSGEDVDKSELFTAFYEDLGKAPMIKECPVNVLCKVINSIEMLGFEMFFGEILAIYADRNCVTENKIDPLKVDPMIMMGSAYYNLGQAVGGLFTEGLEVKARLT